MASDASIRSLQDNYLAARRSGSGEVAFQSSGAVVWSPDGKSWLDGTASLSGVSAGHAAPHLVNALYRSSQRIGSLSAGFGTAAPAELAKALCERTGFSKALFVETGPLAVEQALKVAKKLGQKKRPDGDSEIVTLYGSYFGSTLGTLGIAGSRRRQRPFEPLGLKAKLAHANDFDSLKEAVSHRTAAIVIQPVLLEGGVAIVSRDFIKQARELAREVDALLVLDESGLGLATQGELFACQNFDSSFDIVTTSSLANGLPLYGVLLGSKVADVLEPEEVDQRDNGKTVFCAVAQEHLRAVDLQKLLSASQRHKQLLSNALSTVESAVQSVEKAGSLAFVELKADEAENVKAGCREKGLLVASYGERWLGLGLPITAEESEIAAATAALAETLGVSGAREAAAAKVKPKAAPLPDLLQIPDLSLDQSLEILELADHLKAKRNKTPGMIAPIEGRTVALVFEKPSLRTRVSFETAIRELGGHPVYLSQNDIGMGDRESVRDVAKNLERWCSAIVARLYWQNDLQQMADDAEVPVINALTELQHPCQAFADMMTVRELFGEEKVKVTYVGDGNNVARSLGQLATQLGYPFTICGPENFRLEDIDGMVQTSSLEEGLADAKVVYTDVWVSMGDEHEKGHRMRVFEDYQVNSHVMSLASPEAVFLHCLPAHRGYEVTDDVMDSPQSRVYQQAENRLHVQKAILQKSLMG